MPDREIIRTKLCGFQVQIDNALGHLCVEHDGTITWDQLLMIKTAAWGNARAIEVYPALKDVVNSENMRHLWRLGEHDFCPDLLGEDNGHDGLQARHALAWAEARG